MERRKLLVTGCGRSGTFYASEVWKTQGLDVRHENPIPPNGCMGKDGIASWYMAVDDPDPPFGPSAIGYEFDLIIHQVRYPLEVIASVAQFILREPRSRNYIERNVPGPLLAPEELLMPHKQQLLLMASRYWYFWNLLAKKKASVRVQVENLTASLEWLCDLLKIDYRPGVANSIPDTTNARYLYTGLLYWTISWDEVYKLDADICKKIKLLAETYGYST
jgi:hypothetical protein